MHAFSELVTIKKDKMIGNPTVRLFADSREAVATVQTSTTACRYREFLTAIEHKRVIKNHRRDMEKRKPKGPTVDPATISWAGGFHEQLDSLLTAVRLTQGEINQLGALYQDLEQVLRDTWPGCLVIPFGSLTTGLGIKASDADCLVLLASGGAAARAQAVTHAHRVLTQYPHVFSALVAIPNANTPIVKFYHLPTRTHCDLSFKTLLGVQNSKLVRFLLHADPRVIPLAITIKYWAQVHALTGTGKLSNYALTMLIIFYLQQPGVAILPPIEWLQRDSAHDIVVDAWNTGFMSDCKRLPASANTSSIAELIGGFFEFYSKFNFEEMVVCPYLGRAVKKDTFEDLNQLPVEFERYKTNVTAGVVLPMRSNTSVVVQDPFEQCRNVAALVLARLAADIQAYFGFAADVYEKDKQNSCINFLESILLEKPILSRAKGKGDNSCMNFLEAILLEKLKLPRSKNKSDQTEFRVDIDPGTMINDTALDWQSVVHDALHVIFETILKVKLDMADKVNSDTERQTPGANKMGGLQKNREKVYTGMLTRAIWKRKQFSKLYSVMGFKFLEREKKITEEIMAIDKNVISLPFELTVTYEHNPCSAVLVVRPGAEEHQSFKEFGKFLESVVQPWFVVLSKPYFEPRTI